MAEETTANSIVARVSCGIGYLLMKGDIQRTTPKIKMSIK